MRRFGLLVSISILLALWVAIATPSPAQIFKSLATFDGSHGDQPIGPLVQGTDGNFYGTTNIGGANCNGFKQYGCGTVYKMTSAGTLTALYSFCSKPNCTDGSFPFSGLVQGTDGKFYGTTSGDFGAAGYGTVFKITRKGKLTTLYTFCSQPNCTDGEGPFGGLVQGINGNLYGTTMLGGTGASGTVFKITGKGKLTTIYNFCSQPNCADGQAPLAALIQATDGNFYGTTQYGGTGEGQSGTVFKITPRGALTLLYSFCSQPNCSDGAFPASPLVQGSDGNLYGTTQEGALGGGTVFKITPKGALTTLYTFCSQQPNCTDGGGPFGGLAQGTDGNFYGTTPSGGTGSGLGGEIFRITPEGTMTVLYGFCSQPDCTDGSQPFAGLVQGTDGTFYGVTSSGGIVSCNPDSLGCGTAFSLSVGLGPFVETRPTSGKIGKRVIILGNNLTAATSVEFNGASAMFKIVSGTEITTNVPLGASTGFVTVTTPQGILTSNVHFVVR